VCICVYLCVYIYIYIYIYVYIHIHVYIYIYMYMCICIYIYIYICIYLHTHTHIWIHMYASICICMCIYESKNMCMCISYVYVYKCIYICMHMFIYQWINIYVYICIYVFVFVTCIYSSMQVWIMDAFMNIYMHLWRLAIMWRLWKRSDLSVHYNIWIHVSLARLTCNLSDAFKNLQLNICKLPKRRESYDYINIDVSKGETKREQGRDRKRERDSVSGRESEDYLACARACWWVYARQAMCVRVCVWERKEATGFECAIVQNNIWDGTLKDTQLSLMQARCVSIHLSSFVRRALGRRKWKAKKSRVTKHNQSPRFLLIFIGENPIRFLF